MTLQYVTLVLDGYDAQGNIVTKGSASFVPSVQLTDPGVEWIPEAPIPAVFRAGSVPSVKLLSTDSTDALPNGWTWAVTFSGVPGDPDGFSFYLPYTGGATQYLSALAQIPAVTPMAQYLPLPTGTPTSGQVPVATGSGESSAWGDATGLPLTTLGDLLYENATPASARLAGNTAATRKFLRQTGTGSVSAAPAWDTLQAGDVPTLNQNTTGTAGGLSATLPISEGGTGQVTATAALAGLKGLYTAVPAPLPSGDTTGATDTAALNTALAALSPRETLILPVPGYYINAPLSVPTGCGITAPMAYGVGSTPHIKASSTFSGAAMIANHGWLNNVTFGEDGIEISNLFIDGSNGGNSGPFVSTNGHGIVLATSHSHVHHCYLLNVSGSGIVFADSNQSGSPITSGTIQENYCWDNKVANSGQYCIWVQRTGGSLGMTDGVIARNIIVDPGNGGYYRNTGNNPQINGSNLPYEAVRMDTSAGWWVEDNHAYFCPGGAYFFGTMFGTHVLNNTADMFGTFPWSVVSGTLTATQIIGMALHGIKTDINVPSSAQNYAHPNVVMGNLLNVFEGVNKDGTISPGTGTSSSGCRFTYYDLVADTLAVPAGAPGAAVVTFTGNQAHQNSQGGQSVASCVTTSGQPTVTAAGGAFATVQRGMSVTGTGIPASTFVGSVVTGGSDSITLVQSDLATAQNATANGTVTLTFPAPYSLMEKWTATTSGVVLTGVHAGNQAMGTIIAQPTISATNGAVVSLLAELGGVQVSGSPPSAGMAPVASSGAAAAWTPVLQMLGTTGLSGFALQNATPTIFTWTAPNDGNMHRVTLFGTLIVASTETGGALSLNLTDASNTSRSPVVFAGALSGGNKLLPSGLMFTVYPNTAVSLVQTSALTGGAATLYLEMWGS